MKDTIRFALKLFLFLLRALVTLVYCAIMFVPVVIVVGLYKKGRTGPLLWFTKVFPSPQEVLGVSRGQMFDGGNDGFSI